MADDIKISADWLDDDSSVDGEAALQDPARSPDTYDIYEPPETYTPPLDTPSGVEEAVARLAPASPSVRTDGLQAVLRERRQRARRPLLDGWAVLTADTTMPSGLAVRFTDQFPEVDAERIGLVWDAFLQWLRIEGRNHPRRHGMPSRSVDALLNMLRSDSDSWDDLRRRARPHSCSVSMPTSGSQTHVRIRPAAREGAATRPHESSAFTPFSGRASNRHFRAPARG